MSNKIYILTHSPYHDNDWYFGAYSTAEKARAALAAFKMIRGENHPDTIVEINIDEPAKFDACVILQ